MLQATIDRDGYPTKASLRRIENWPVIPNGYTALLDFIEPIFEERGGLERDGDAVTLITRGWSGCEDAIGALRNNTMFWMMCWQSSERGGRYKFAAPEMARGDGA